ncbi:hypothetical protein [Gulosibacter bifidus]|uniref:Uncharacterized protein n=1 Tax=Gulosibacter bifidus TaxID=272239 RepID=A0ABW5RL07_9MICO|nr:hypothetical protein [Gulosibacter bifidus]
MFGWFRKRNKHEQQADIAPQVSEMTTATADAGPASSVPAAQVPAAAAAPAAQTAMPVSGYDSPTGPAVEAPTDPVQLIAPTAPEMPALPAVAPLATEPAASESMDEAETSIELADATPEFTAPNVAGKSTDHALMPAPSARPAMPLSAHPNFIGFDLAPVATDPPKMLQPKAALTAEAQHELYRLFDDMFGPTGRYRLEWRTNREMGDDAMFAEMMTQDMVRRVQNAVADVSELERPAPLRAITSREHNEQVKRDNDRETSADAA